VAPVAGTGWRVLVGISRSSLTARIQKETLQILVPLLALLAVSNLIGLLIARRVWRPLQALSESVTQVSQGEHVPVPIDSTDEVGDLTRAFNTMADQVREATSSLETRLAEMTGLLEATRLLSGTLELPEILQRLTEIARTLLKLDFVHIWFLDPTTATLVLQDCGEENRPRGEFRTRMNLQEGLSGWIMSHQAPLVEADIQANPRVLNPGWLQAEGIVSFLGIPLVLKNTSVGVLSGMTRVHRDFSPNEVALAEALASQATIAIENARLVKNLQQALDDLKAAQNQLARTEALRATGELAAGMAHHLNNMLAVIGGQSELLMQKTREPALCRSLGIIEQTVRRAAEVIQRMHSFGRKEPVSQAVPLDLNRIAEEALELTRPRWKDQAEREGIQIEARLEPGRIPAGAGDPASLKEALVNLLLNAVDALPGGGKITVRTWASEQQVHCSVTDNGLGMPEEVRQRAAQPFFTTKGPKSTGLGLSVTHGVVQRHGGSLAIESAEGKGTTVTINLPVFSATPAVRPAPTPAPAAVSARRILVIDDEAEVAETLAEILTRQGHTVTDLGMPGMSGWKVAEAIKTMAPETPVILVTGWGDQVDLNSPAGRWVDSVLQKPFHMAEVAAAMAQPVAKARGSR